MAHLSRRRGMALHLRMTFSRRKLRSAVEQMLRWRPERVLIAHGQWFTRDGEAELRKAICWPLPRRAPT